MLSATAQSHHRVRHEARALVRLAAPIALAQFGLMTMGLVDTAVLGRVSKIDLAAAALGRNIGFAAQTLAMGLAMALEQLASQAVGADDVARAWRSFTATLRTIGLTWIPTVLVAFAATFALPRIGVAAPVVHRTREFLLAWAPGLFAFPCFIAAKTFLQAHGRTRPALVAAIVANIVNLVVCSVLVRGDDALAAAHLPRVGLPALGALGSGIALSVAGLLLAGMVVRSAWLVRPASLADAPRVSQREVFRVGLPVGAQMLAEVGVFALVSVLTGHFGSAVVSANQIALGLASFTFMGALGVSGATAVRVGHAYGRVDREGARRAGLTGIALGAATMATSAVVFATAPEILVRFFTHDADIVALGAALVRVAAVFQLFDGMQAVGAGALRGAGDVRFAFGAGVFSYWIVGLPLALFFGFSRGRGALGMWWGLSASLIAAAILFLVRFIALTRKPKGPLFGATPALD
ncbi:MAG TPA: MATE family efflux transporter [Polyangiaceae bacterium]